MLEIDSNFSVRSIRPFVMGFAVSVFDSGEKTEIFLGQVGEFACKARLWRKVRVVIERRHDDLRAAVVRHGDGFGARGENAFADAVELPRGLGGEDGPHERFLSGATRPV